MIGDSGRKMGWRAAIALVLSGGLVISAALANNAPVASIRGGEEAALANVDLGPGYTAIEVGEYDGAIAFFHAVLVDYPGHAEAYNQLGYINRRLQNFDRAFAFYAEALKIAPDNTGAHHYIGEAYLEVGNLAKAEYHLRQLDLLCLFGCADFYQLEQAVALYKANNTS